MKRLYLDLETCGLYGVPVIAQYAIEDTEVKIWDFWNSSALESMLFIESLCGYEIVGFNLVFDWFHINKFYNILAKVDPDLIPEDDIEAIFNVEKEAKDGVCVKPISCVDLLLFARQTNLQITMERKDLIIRRVPRVVALNLQELLEQMPLNPILFARRSNPYLPKFSVEDTKNPELVNLVLRFRPSSALKSICQYQLNKRVTTYKEIELDDYPEETGYSPTSDGRFRQVGEFRYYDGQGWPAKIKAHLSHWRYNKLAIEYAINDIKYTRELDNYWGRPKSDNNSILACSVAASRWKGYKVDLAKIDQLIATYKERKAFPTAPNRVKEYLGEVLSPLEKLVLDKGTSKAVLLELSEWDHPVAIRAKQVLSARSATKKIELFNKLKRAGRFHASLKIVGTLSNRMSGADGLNPQAIDRSKEVRSAFPLAFDDELLPGGDMQSFEISIADAVYNDPKLRKELLTCVNCNLEIDRVCPKCGGSETRSFHGLFGQGFWPHLSYDEILATKGTENDLYTPAKTAAFATLYGAQAQKLCDVLHISEEEAEEGLARFWQKYSQAGKVRRDIETDYAKIYESGKLFKLKEAKNSISSLLGWKRYFELEHSIIEYLFNLADTLDTLLPKNLANQEILRNSNKGVQKVVNATRSALYGAMFQLQNSVIRQAANHQIQSTGAEITKDLQCALWELQPVGVHPWHVRPLNIHDEIQCPCKPELVDKVKEVVNNCVEKHRKIVPLIGIDFGILNSWADK